MTRHDRNIRHLATRPPHGLAVRARMFLLMLLPLVVGMALTGCTMETRVIDDGWRKWKRLFNAGGGGGQENALAGDEWTIALHRFTGPEREAAAERMTERIQQQTGLDDLWVDDNGGTATVYHGRFTDPQEARSARDYVRSLAVGGQRAFASAQLITLGGGADRSADSRDFKQFSGRYALQIAYYDDKVDGDRRAVAAREARALHEQGHDAYYYHGPSRSLVLIGAFTYQQAFVTRNDPRLDSTKIDAYSPRIRKLQEQFPYNLANRTDLAKVHQKEHPDAQRSSLVEMQ